MKKIYSNKQKEETINHYYTGATSTELSNKTGIARSTIYRWIRESDECEKKK